MAFSETFFKWLSQALVLQPLNGGAQIGEDKPLNLENHWLACYSTRELRNGPSSVHLSRYSTITEL